MSETLISDSFGLLSLLIIIPTILFSMAEHPKTKGFFEVVPILLFAYFVPTALSSFGIIPQSAPAYSLVKSYILPACLVLLTLSADVKSILRLGPKALIMFLSGSIGVMIGGIVSYMMFRNLLPQDAWKGLSALCGSWIGGGANFVAVGESVGASESMLGSIAVVDIIIGSAWTGLMMFMAGKSKQVDDALGADNSAIEDLKNNMIAFQKESSRIPNYGEFFSIFAIAFGGAWVAIVGGDYLPPVGDVISHTTWKIILATTIGLSLSFTRARSLDGVGASKFGSLLLFMLIGVIGAGAQFSEMAKHPYLLIAAAVWISIHIIIMGVVMKLIRAPLFFTAVGSQANVGGAASAPIVASAFHPSLATVGVLLGVFGNIVGTYLALFFAQIISTL